MDEWPKWFAVHTQARCEDKARINLKRAGYWVWMPFTRETIRVGKKKLRRVVERPWLSRYIFVCLRRPDEAIGPVNDAIGVSRVVCRPMSGEPLQIPTRIIDDLMELADGEMMTQLKAPHWFRGKAGDTVVIDESDPASVLCGKLATIVSLSGLDRKDEIIVAIKMLGKEQDVSLPAKRVAVVRQAA